MGNILQLEEFFVILQSVLRIPVGRIVVKPYF